MKEERLLQWHGLTIKKELIERKKVDFADILLHSFVINNPLLIIC